MSNIAPSDPVRTPSQGSKSKKNKRKKAAEKAKTNGDVVNSNGVQGEAEPEIQETETASPTAGGNGTANGTTSEKQIQDLEGSDVDEDEAHNDGQPIEPSAEDHAVAPLRNGLDASSLDDRPPPASVSDERFEALVRDRDTLRAEVTELRKSLEDIQSKHQAEVASVTEQLEETLGEKDHAETQYRNLLGKVNTIKSQLGERLKADAEELGQARTKIEDLEDQNINLRKETEAKTTELATLAEEGEQRSKELSSLRNRTNLSQQNWLKEREELVERERHAKEEFEAAKEAMHDWEVLAMEERSIRENLGEKAADLEEQVSSYKEAYEKASSERDSQSVTVDGLQRALQEIQTARKKELRELVETSQAQVEELRKHHQEAEKQASEANAALEATKKELERALPFEKEVKEKNLLIGKLRHEAVILNDHLTKALRFLKKGKPEDNVDRQIVTNHLLHFLALDRSDPKKFQILQLIAALLGWNDEQREQAGLARPGASSNTGSLRTPISPFHRTPSTPALATEYFPDHVSAGATKESLAELWSNFLEQEAQAGSKGTGSRSGSMSGPPKPPPKPS